MSGKRQPLAKNSFQALALAGDEHEPRKALQMQSSRNQKKLEYQAKKALCGSPGSGGPSSSRQQQRPQQPSSRRDSLDEALAAIAIAESQETAKQAELLRQQRQQGSSAFAAAAAASAAAVPRRAASLAPAGSSSLSASPAMSGDSGWPTLWQTPPGGSSGDPWSVPNQQQEAHSCSDRSISPAHSFASMLQEQQERQQPRRLQQQEEEGQHQQQEPWPALDGRCSQGAGWEPCISSGQAYSWRNFAMQFAEAARAAGDEEAADGALLFSAGESLSAAVFADDSAVAELEDVAVQAAAAGLTVQELLQAQQEELLLQINKAKRKGPVWRQVQLDWANSSSSSAAGRAEANPSSSNSSRGPSPSRLQLQLPDVGDECSFPQLEPSALNAAGWQQAGRSPHSIPKGWRGGRMAPKAKGIKLLHTPNSSSSSSKQEQPRPSQADLHWDLRLDGLAPMQREGQQADSLLDIDPWGGVRNPSGYSGAQAAERTRQLLTEQEAAATTAGARPAASRDRCAQDTVRAMMQKAGAKGSSQPAAADAVGDAMGDEGGMTGSKAAFSYSWGSVFKAAVAAGWVPVPKAEGGGGSHFKLRRVLPLSGVTQTIVLPCTPSDSQRGVRNVAAGFKKRDDERLLLEAQASASAAQKQADSQGKAGAARGKRKT